MLNHGATLVVSAEEPPQGAGDSSGDTGNNEIEGVPKTKTQRILAVLP